MDELLRIRDKAKRARNAEIFRKIVLVIIRFIETILIYMVPSFVVTYITMYMPKDASWKVLCFLGYAVALFGHWFTAKDYYQRCEGNLKKYFIVTNISYFVMMVFSFWAYFFVEENLLLFNFCLSILRGFEVFYEKTIFSMIVAHFITIVMYTLVPIVLKAKDRKAARFEKIVMESQDEIDKMGMIFNPDELPDLPQEEPVLTGGSVGLLFDPDEKPIYDTSVFVPIDAIDAGYAGGLLFNPDEMPASPEFVEEKTNDREDAVGLLFDPDEMPDYTADIFVPMDDIDAGYAGGLLFNPDEMPEIPDDTAVIKTDEEEPLGLLFDPDEIEVIEDYVAISDDIDEDYVGGLFFDPD